MATKTFRRIILHAGLHKTGTTSIQDNCYKYRDELLEQGFVYPGFRYGDKVFANHSDPIATAITTKARFYGAAVRLKNFRGPKDATRVFQEQLRDVMESAAADTLLLSAELVCDFNERDMKTLRRYLEEYTDTLDVIVVVRSPQDALISAMQQRCRDGHPSDPAKFPGLFVERYKRLQQVFADRMKVINFHQATGHGNGLVGYFLQEIGVPDEALASLQFSSSNERISMEAFVLMKAINDAFPRGRDEHGLKRRHLDMRSLHALPGLRFGLAEPLKPEISESLREQREWLESEMQTRFPDDPPTLQDGALWQDETLQELERCINSLASPGMRQVSRQKLEEEAGRLEGDRPDTAAVLRFIAARVIVTDDPPMELLLQGLGADYFKYAALQIERGSIETALLLMEVAHKLRADAPLIEERIQYYRKRLKDS